jgi:hypothetical protein
MNTFANRFPRHFLRKPLTRLMSGGHSLEASEKEGKRWVTYSLSK